MNVAQMLRPGIEGIDAIRINQMSGFDEEFIIKLKKWIDACCMHEGIHWIQLMLKESPDQGISWGISSCPSLIVAN